MKNHKRRRRIAALRRGGKDDGDGSSRGHSGYSRPPLARMMRLHEWLMANRFPNCRKMAEEFEVSAKTIQRDVNFMRDQMGLPIEYDNARFGFHYSRPVHGFPALEGPAVKSPAGSLSQAIAGIGEKPVLVVAGREALSVRIGFDAKAARLVRARTWHPSQVIHPMPGGGVQMTMQTRDERAVVDWVLSWGAHAWVIEPLRVRNRIREVAQAILAHY